MTLSHRLRMVGLGVTSLVMGVTLGVPAANAVEGPTPTGAIAAATVRVDVGGQQACSGALVDRMWVVTAASCFTDSTGPVTSPGKPRLATTATIGRVDLTGTTGHVVAVDRLVPHPDRDVVLARLTTPVTDVAAVTVASTAPVVGERVTVAGYGRTATQLVPDTAHAATYAVTSVAAATIDLQATSAGSTICKGDAGGPALRTTATGAIELLGIHHTSYQGGCFGQASTMQGATETRLDNLRSWVSATVVDVPVTRVMAADWSGDAHADVLGVDARGVLWYYPHNGSGLTARVSLGEGWGSFAHVMAADYSGDGRADVLGVDATGRLWYYPHNGNGLSAPVQIGSGWGPFTHVTADDWNNDGRADVLGVDATGALWLYTNTNLRLSARVSLGHGWGSFRQVMAADYSGDGHADVVGVDAGGKLWYYPHNGAGLTSPTQIGNGWGTFKAVMASDWSGDGRADILGVDSSAQLWVYTNIGGNLPARTLIGGAPQMM